MKQEQAKSDAVTDYAERVIGGEIVTGRLVRLACERHIRDLETGRERGLWFDAIEAQATIDFWEICPHLKGEKAKEREDIRLEAWQKFVIGSLYGWKNADGSRRFRIAFIEMGRKNGKSTLVYPCMIHGLTLDGEEGAEIYSVATKKDQARLVYSFARRAVLRVPEFSEVLQPYRDVVVNDDTFGKFEALGADADTLDGLNPSVAIADEVHKWRGRQLWDVIETGMGARKQPLMIAITTAGEDNTTDVYGQERDYTEQVVSGLIDDDRRFGYIACLDAADDWTDPTNFIKANPNLGVSVFEDEIAGQIEKAKHSPAAANAVKRLRLGIRSQDEDAWIPVQTWDAGKASIDWNMFKGRECAVSLDTTSSTDIAAYSECYPINEDLTAAEDKSNPWGYVFRLKMWIPKGYQNPVEKRLREIVDPWVPQWIEYTEGDVIDHDVIENYIRERNKECQITRLSYDPRTTSIQLAVRLQSFCEVEPMNSTLSRYSASTKRFGELVMAGRIKHDGSPVMRWMIANSVIQTNGVGHQMPSRKKSRNKIEGVMACVMSLDGLITAPVIQYVSSNLITV